jgi:environmental stress-induced protein Ves
MVYSIEIIRKNEQNTSTWSGGTTTELAIYPKGASYRDRNFVWRLSSANVELEDSTFTSLPGIWRYIMIIEGEMELEHEEHHKTHLKPYEQDSFNGGWITKSKGKVRDFNLMLTNGYKGKIEAIHVIGEANIKEICPNQVNIFTQAIYCTEGEIEIEIDKKQNVNIYEGDLVMIGFEPNPANVDIKIVNKSNKVSSVIKTIIYK